MPADDPSLAETLTDLEVRLAFHDRAVQVLDELVRTLFGRVETLEKELSDLRKTAGSAVEVSNEAPPHY